jgi:hypothetical protein
MRHNPWIIGHYSPDCNEGIPESPTGIVLPDAAQIATRMTPIGEITARWQPGKNGYQGGIMGAGQILRVAQCAEATR